MQASQDRPPQTGGTPKGVPYRAALSKTSSVGSSLDSTAIYSTSILLYLHSQLYTLNQKRQSSRAVSFLSQILRHQVGGGLPAHSQRGRAAG